MIQTKNILLTQAIARELREKKIFLTPDISRILRGLNAASYYGFQYDETTVAKVVPIVTRDDTDHTERLEIASDAIAANFRERFNNIRTIVTPLVNKIVDQCHTKVETSWVVDNMMDRVDLSFYQIKDEVLNYPYYPKELLNNAINYKAIDFANVIKGKYQEITNIEELLVSNDNDINTLLDKYKHDIKSYYRDIFISKENPFEGFKPENIERVFAFWLFINKLHRSETPIEEVTGISLDDYRGELHYVLSVLQYQLVEMAKVIRSLSSVGLAITTNEAILSTASIVPTIAGKVVVWYKPDVVAKINDIGSTLSEVIYGYLIGSLLHKTQHGFDLNKAADYVELFRQTNQEFGEKAALIIAEKYTDIMKSCIEDFVMENPGIKAIVDKTFNSKYASEKVPEYKHITYMLGAAYNKLFKEIAISNPEDIKRDIRTVIMGSDLIIELMKCIGMENSANIVLATRQVIDSEEVDIIKIREKNTEAVVETLVCELLNQDM